MQPQDTYDRDFDVATTALDHWLDGISAVAVIDREHTADFWRARIEPHQANGCPAELVLSRRQTFDIEIGPENLADQPVADFALFVPLLDAIAAGHVVHRRWSAAATRCGLTREIIVRLADGTPWSMRRIASAGTAASELSATATDRAFVPYRRD